MWNTFYVGTQQEILQAIAQIDANCGFPDGYTETWGHADKAYELDFWFVLKPAPQGYKEPNRQFTQSTMISGIGNVAEAQSDPSWWPTPPKAKK